MIARLVRDLLVGTVWAGALTALALDSAVMGTLLLAAGLLQLVHLHHTPPGPLLGASSTPTAPSRGPGFLPSLAGLHRVVTRAGASR